VFLFTQAMLAPHMPDYSSSRELLDYFGLCFSERREKPK
jgi:hypothetical protein